MNNDKPKWASLHAHSSNGSLLDGFSQVPDYVKRCKELGYESVALTDHGTVSSIVQLFKECKSNDMKPIAGIELYVSDLPATQKDAQNRSLSHLVVLCKNLTGWYELVKLVSESNNEENYYYKPRVDFEMLRKYLGNGNHIAISGHPGSTLADKLFTSGEVYRAKGGEEAQSCLVDNWEKVLSDEIDKHIEVFGENFFGEIQLIDRDRLAMAQVLADCIRKVCKDKGVRTVATGDSHYVRKSDAIYQRILLCSSLNRTLPSIYADIRKGKDVPLGGFFLSDNYHVPSYEELAPLHTEEELSNAVLISEMCEDYNILSGPKLPHFQCPDNLSESDFLKKLCSDGWSEKIANTPKENDEYKERLKTELDVLIGANLSGYFLIVWDIVNYMRSKGWITPTGRGSAAGCLTSYLLGITSVDPIPYGLLMERFYDYSRAGSLPDIDLDVPSEHREEIIQYVKDKYGERRVSQMATFGTLMGRSAVKEVLRAEGEVSFVEVNEITEFIPDEAEIADELEEMENKSIILWALQNRGPKFEKWVTLNENGSLSGPLAESFSKAIKLEGTHKSQGKHAAGIIISSDNLDEVCPMIRDKDGRAVSGFSMGDMEALGHVKFDILGIDLMSKIMKITEYFKGNYKDFSDKATWDMLSSGDTKGVFQLEKQKRWTKKLKPQNMHHLAALLSVIRPGVVEAVENGKSMTEWFMDRKNGKEETPSIHPVVDKILHPTYSVLVYQEQAMFLAKGVAGFNMIEANSLRKAIGKKLPELMAKLKIEFLEKSKSFDSTPYEIAEKIFDWIEKSQRYSFCAAHAYSYAENAFYSAYLKCHCPLKFYEVYLNHARNKQDPITEIKELVNDARAHGIHVYGPNLENFHYEFTMNEAENFITFGISNLKEVGAEAKKIIALKEEMGNQFVRMSWIEILREMVYEAKVNKKAMTAMISCGALNGPNNKTSRNRMLYEYEVFKSLTDKEVTYIVNNLNPKEDLLWHIKNMINCHKIGAARLKKVIGQMQCLEHPPHSLEDTGISTSQYERKYMGISVTNDELLGDIIGSLVTCTCEDIRSGSVRGPQSILGTITNVKEIKIKKEGSKYFGQLMCFCSVQDSSGELNSIVVFPELYKDNKATLCNDNLVLFSGKVENRQGEYSLICERIMQA
jgi:DNA polymerase-3 subunit alpha